MYMYLGSVHSQCNILDIIINIHIIYLRLHLIENCSLDNQQLS